MVKARAHAADEQGGRTRDSCAFATAVRVIFPPGTSAVPDHDARSLTAVKSMAQAIHSADMAAKHGPSRKDAHRRFNEIASHAHALARLLQDSALYDDQPQLLAMGGKPSAAPWVGLNRLADEATRIANAIPTNGGRHSAAEALGQPSGSLVCALAARALRYWSTGNDHSDKDTHLIEACQALWVAAGGQAPTELGGAGWELHLAAARKARAAPRTAAELHALAAVNKVMASLPSRQ